MQGFPYHGHFIWLDPEETRGAWDARVIVEVHSKGTTERIHYRDHLHRYPSHEEALEASREFGRRMIDDFTLPAVGEGDYQGGGPSST